jgi:hypothetical protein
MAQSIKYSNVDLLELSSDDVEVLLVCAYQLDLFLKARAIPKKLLSKYFVVHFLDLG